MKINVRRTMLAGLAFMSISSFWAVYDAVTPLILKNTFHLNEVLNGAVMAMDNVLALFLLPVFGIMSDKTNTKLGKRIPYIIGGTALASIAMLFMPIADNANNLLMFFIATGLVLLFMSFYRTPAVAITPDITPRQLRSKANAVIMLMGTFGVVYALVAVKFLTFEGADGKPDYIPLFVSIIAIMIVSVLIQSLTVRENKWAEEAKEKDKDLAEEKDDKEGKKLGKAKLKSLVFLLFSVAFWYMAYNAVNSAFSRYSLEVLHLKNGEYATYILFATLAAVVSYVPIGFFSQKFGRKKVILAGVIGLALAFGSCAFFREGGIILKIVFCVIGISWAAINVNSYPMVVEIASDGDVGRYSGYYYTFSMAAQVITPILSGVFLQYVSYKSLFPYGFVFSALALITMTQVRHGDIITDKKKSILEHLDVD